MQRFAETCEAVAATAKKTEKVRRVADYLCSLPVEDAARVAIFFTARPFPRCEERTLEVGSAQLWQTVAQRSGADEDTMARVYRQHGDLGGMVAELLVSHTLGRCRRCLRRAEPCPRALTKVTAARSAPPPGSAPGG
ncbi:MAG: hypothetical protein ACE5MH_06980 [Terriglobia bacterium]